MKRHRDSNQASEPTRIDMNQADMDRLVSEIRASNLSQETGDLVIKILLGWRWLSLQLEQKSLSLKKMMGLFFGSKTEKIGKKDQSSDPTVQGKPDDDDSDDDMTIGASKQEDSSPRPKAKGHGKNGAAQYEAAERIPVSHPTLRAGDLCPECKDAKLYFFGNGSVVRFFGQPPIVAKVFEPEQLRCPSCQELFSAALPDEAGVARHTPTAQAMVALLTSGAGLPAYRLEGLQAGLGIKLADSTQSDIREEMADHIYPLHQHLEKLAAGGTLLHNDDTPNKILDLMKENKSLPEGARVGVQTTGIVSLLPEGQRVALIRTGREHAGENLARIMRLRDQELTCPLQMGDAAKMNVPKEFENLLVKCLCLDHGRRNFFELLEEFKTDCRYVVEELAKIYKHDGESKKLQLSPIERLRYHQEHSLPVMNGLNAWMEEQLEDSKVEPNSNLGRAITYFLKHWNGLTQFLRVEGAPLSNAEVERLLKKCVLRRKNSMFYKTQAGAWIGDVLMTVIETARMNGANLFDYLVALRTHSRRVRANPENWLPWNFKLALAGV